MHECTAMWKCSNEMLETKNTRHVIRILKIGFHGQNHAILSSVRVSEGHGLIDYTALTLYYKKTTVQNFTHSTQNKANT